MDELWRDDINEDCVIERMPRWADICVIKNLYRAWRDFSKGKKKREDVLVFESHLEDELWRLHTDLVSEEYRHGGYEKFFVHDPKRRMIHKATVRDRVVHRLLYNALLTVFHPRWLDCSFSCRPGFGQHRSLERVRRGLREATQDWSRECIALKCDIRKFFDSVDHGILERLLFLHLKDAPLRLMLSRVIDSFETSSGIGLPIGNLTSQLFANVYMHELDWHAKHELKLRWYYRYADDMLVLCHSLDEVKRVCEKLEIFLSQTLRLFLHPKKVVIRKSTWGVDWLGHVILPGHEALRPATRRRMMRRVRDALGQYGSAETAIKSIASYHGLLAGTARKTIDCDLLQAVALWREM